MVTDSAGHITDESDYYPWGGEFQFASSGKHHYKFTGKERDIESGLDYFGARYYGSALGRFITPDWSSTPVPVPYADLADPQSLNQYGYVRNLPTSKVDPDGHCCLQELEELAETVEAGTAEGAAMIATAARATVGSAVTITVATSAVVYHSVQATRAVIKANKADEGLIQAEHKLNEAIIKKQYG